VKPNISTLLPLMITLAVVLPHRLAGAQPPPPRQALTCDIKPVERTIAESKWLIYSCDDGVTLVLVTAPGSKALPFAFQLHPTSSGYRLVGEGTGSKAATDPVAEALSTLSAQDIATIIEQTKAVKKR
jgi:hypothetical protein